MIPQNHALPLLPQRSRQPFPLRLTENNTPKILIHGLRISIKVAHILINHLKLLPECTPRFPRFAMHMARSMDIRPRLMHRGMDQKSRPVSRTTRIPADHFPIVIDEHHVRGLEGREVLSQRVRPEGMRVFRVADRDVAAHALGEALAGEDAERARHVREDPCAVLIVGREERDSGECYALGDGFEGGLLLVWVVLGDGDELVRGLLGDCRGCHLAQITIYI